MVSFRVALIEVLGNINRRHDESINLALFLIRLFQNTGAPKPGYGAELVVAGAAVQDVVDKTLYLADRPTQYKCSVHGGFLFRVRTVWGDME